MNNIVIELHPEDRARLDAIIAGLCKLQVVEGAIAPAAAPAADPKPAPVETPPAAQAADSIHASVLFPSLADFQKAVALRCAENPAVKPKVRELVNRYAASVSEIPPEKRLEFLDLLAKV